MDLTIRRFRDADARPLAEWLVGLVPAEEVYTAASVIHQRRMLPASQRPLWLVAVVDGEPVGLARNEPQIFGGSPGLRRTWVGVRPELRKRGIGSRLWQPIEAHARDVGGLRLRSWAIADAPEGERFLLARGFAPARRELQSWIDPTSLDPALVERCTAEAQERGFRVVRLREVLPTGEPVLRQLFLSADRDAPGRHPSAPAVAATTFRRVVLRNPLLDLDRSAVVLHRHEPVALCWLKGDLASGRYGVEFTATAPAWRGQGLATLAKLSALHLAARAGIRWVGTANDESNAPMLAVNRRLGHRPLPDLMVYERGLEEAPDHAAATAAVVWARTIESCWTAACHSATEAGDALLTGRCWPWGSWCAGRPRRPACGSPRRVMLARSARRRRPGRLTWAPDGRTATGAGRP